MDELKDAIREVCYAIAHDDDKSPLRWSYNAYGYGISNSIWIHNLTDEDFEKVCTVKAVYSGYPQIRVNYSVRFIGKYYYAARTIQCPVEASHYKFVQPKHIIDFVKAVIHKTNEKPIIIPPDVYRYAEADVLATEALYKYRNFGIVDVIFNDPATIIIWADGSKTVVKAENEPFDPEKGMAMAISKKVLGNKYDYYDIFKKYVGRYEKKQAKKTKKEE